jgi:hypothetical protein
VAVWSGGEERFRGHEGAGWMRGGVAGVENEVVVDLEFFEEPEDALRLRALEG